MSKALQQMHTREPWHATASARAGRMVLFGMAPGAARLIGTLIGGGSDFQILKADAARIAACVNACSGIPDPESEIKRLQAADQASPAGQAAVVDKIMEQAQVFASAWALVSTRFDNGGALEDANKEKAALRAVVAANLAALRRAKGLQSPSAAPLAELSSHGLDLEALEDRRG